jgi:hypothetical protein
VKPALDVLPFADSDMLGRHTQLNFERVLRFGGQEICVATNSEEFMNLLLATKVDEGAKNLPGNWKVVLRDAEPSGLKEPTLLRRGSTIHGAFGDVGWMVANLEARELIVFFCGTADEVLRQLMTMDSMIGELLMEGR